MIKDILKYSISNLWLRKSRSFLTILSILIGVTSIFALSSFGLGMQHFIEDYAKKMGTDKIMIAPKDYITAIGRSNIILNKDDLDFIKKIKGVDEATGMTATSGKIKFKNYKEKYNFIIGFSTEPKEKKLVEEMFSGIEIEKGRTLKKGDTLKAVLGYNYLVPNRIFPKAISVGDKIEINDIPVEVIGFYSEIGNPSDDAQVYLSLEGFEEIVGKKEYDYIVIRSAPSENPTILADIIKEKFRKYKNQDKGQEDFFVQTFEQMLQTYTAVLNVLVGILVLIALISVVVAAVNIMNTMYTSILERTNEIGVMKSIGAKNILIMVVFTIESTILGAIGGVIGIILGYAIAKFGGLVAAFYGISMLKPYFPIWLILGCIVFASIVGLVAGLLPARQASKLNPVDALRYE